MVGSDKDGHLIEKSQARRRGFVKLAISFAIASIIGGLGLFFKFPRRPQKRKHLRPPGSLQEQDFLSACVRCGLCADACPNECIKFHGFTAGLQQAYTPYINARERGCILCGKCAEACPTEALNPFDAHRESWIKNVHMGTARVNKSMCYSFAGRTCGACYRACPLAGQAMTIGVFETPIVHPENCVGCGLCEQACIHLPQAIRVIPV